MADGFAELLDRSNTFFRALARNNTRDWFEPRRAEYTNEIKKPAELLGDIMAEELARLTGARFKPKLFRIHRDVRFSKDKTPYNAHLHLMWSGDDPAAPSWFFGSSPDYCTLFTGLPGLSGAALTRFRAMIDRGGDALKVAMAKAETDVGACLSDFGAAPLKRVPRPFDADHPHGDLLRRKSLILGAPPAGDWRDTGFLPALTATARGLLPVWRVLNAGMTA